MGESRHRDESARELAELRDRVRQLQSELAGGSVARRRDRDALLQSQARFERFANNSNDIIWTIRPDGRIDSVNAAGEALLGYRRDEALGMPIAQYMTAESVARSNASVQEALSSVPPRRNYTVEVDYVRKDGSLLPVEASVHIVLDDDGNEVAFEGISRDISERRRAEEERARLEEQLRQSQKMESIGRLAGGVAHDFNNLLTGIGGYAEVLLEELGPEHPLACDVREIRGAAERAAGLTAQLLAFSRKQVIAPRVLSPHDVLEHARGMLGRIIGEDIELVLDSAPDVGHVKADPVQMDQILVNLAANARDAMPEGGRLTFAAEDVVRQGRICREHELAAPREFVLISVVDTGHGMDEETSARIFEPFFSTKAPHEGSGLGLATVYGIVRQNEGHIDVRSEPGVGTRVDIYLPRVHEPAIPRPESKAPVAPPEGRETILLVEDEAAVRRLALRILERQGYAALAASNGEEALRLSATHASRIDLLLTDVVMPEMDGHRLAEAMRRSRSDLRVLFMSGYAENAIANQGVLAEGTAFLAKPFNLRSLSAAVRDVLDAPAGAETGQAVPPSASPLPGADEVP